MKPTTEGKGIKEFKVRKMPNYILKDITKLQKIIDKVARQKPTGIFAEKEIVDVKNLHLEDNKWKMNPKSLDKNKTNKAEWEVEFASGCLRWIRTSPDFFVNVEGFRKFIEKTLSSERQRLIAQTQQETLEEVEKELDNLEEYEKEAYEATWAVFGRGSAMRQRDVAKIIISKMRQVIEKKGV